MKGRPWCADLPIVDVPQGDQPKPITMVLPYYCNPDFLRRQIAWWGSYSLPLRSHLSAIVVDDGSPDPATLPSVLPFPIRLFRIEVDRRWNWLAARNIGFHHAPEGWCLVTDIDHVVPASTADALVYGKHDPAIVYGFQRIEHTGEKVGPHSASFFMTRQMFWKVGGYDERCSGYYGTDGHYRRRLTSTAPMHLLTDRLVRHEYQGDSSTTRYLRKQPEDAKLRALMRTLKPGSKPKTLSFPYHEVTA